MQISDLHDWEIKSIETDHKSRSVILKLQKELVASKNIVVFLDGVEQFHATGMKLQNVVLDAVLFDMESKSDDLEYCKKVLGRKDLKLDGTMVIFYIEPSVGVELVCFCQKCDIKIL